MPHMRDGFGTVVVAEFRGGFFADVHSRDSGASGVMGRPLGDVVDFSPDDDPAVVSLVVQGDLFARDGAWRPGGSSRRPELAGDSGVIGLGGFAEIPRSQSLGRQFEADLAGVVRIDPGVILAAALVVCKGRAHPLVERLEQSLLLSGVSGSQVIEGEFGAKLEAGGAVMPHAFVVQ